MMHRLGLHPYTFTLSTIADPEYRNHIQGILRAHNTRMSTLRGPDAEPLNIRITNPQGQLVGGIVASTYWGWLVIDLLAVIDEVRGQGLGKQLMQQAEAEGRARGCAYAHTSTYAHQALGFYQHLGYRIVGQLDDYPDGYTLYWLRKDL